MAAAPKAPRRGMVSYIDEIDDEEILAYIQKIRRIGGLPDLELESRGGRVCETITYEHNKRGKKVPAEDVDNKNGRKKTTSYHIEVETDSVGTMSKYTRATKPTKKPMAKIAEPASKETVKSTVPAKKAKVKIPNKVKERIIERASRGKSSKVTESTKEKARITAVAASKEKAKITKPVSKEKAKITGAASKETAKIATVAASKKAKVAKPASKEKAKITETAKVATVAASKEKAKIAVPASNEKAKITETANEEKAKIASVVACKEKAKITETASEEKVTEPVEEEKKITEPAEEEKKIAAPAEEGKEKILRPPLMARTVRSFGSSKSSGAPSSRSGAPAEEEKKITAPVNEEKEKILRPPVMARIARSFGSSKKSVAPSSPQSGVEESAKDVQKHGSSEKGGSIFSRVLPKTLVRSMTAPAHAFFPSGAVKSVESSGKVEATESPSKDEPMESSREGEPSSKPVDRSNEVGPVEPSGEVELPEEDDIVVFQKFNDTATDKSSTHDVDAVGLKKRVSSDKGDKGFSRFLPKSLVRSKTAPANAVFPSDEVEPVKPSDEIDPADEEEIVPFRNFKDTPKEKPSTSEAPAGSRGEVKLVDEVPKAVARDKRYMCGDVAIEDLDPGGYCAPSWYEIMDTCAMIGSVWSNHEELLDPLIPLDAEDGAYDSDSLDNESLESLLDGEDLLLEAQV